MKTGDATEFLKLHRERDDIKSRNINLTDEQIQAIEYLANDQDLLFEDMAMVLIQYQMQLIEVQHRADIHDQARRN